MNRSENKAELKGWAGPMSLGPSEFPDSMLCLEQLAAARESRCVTERYRDFNPTVLQRLARLRVVHPSSDPRI